MLRRYVSDMNGSVRGSRRLTIYRLYGKYIESLLTVFEQWRQIHGLWTTTCPSHHSSPPKPIITPRIDIPKPYASLHLTKRQQGLDLYPVLS